MSKTRNKQQFNELYLGKAVWCKTEELAKEFLSLADSFGYRWCSGCSLLKNSHWGDRRADTCYIVIKDFLMLDNRTWLMHKGSDIIEFKSLKEDQKLGIDWFKAYWKLYAEHKLLEKKSDNQRKALRELHELDFKKSRDLKRLKKELNQTTKINTILLEKIEQMENELLHLRENNE